MAKLTEKEARNKMYKLMSELGDLGFDCTSFTAVGRSLYLKVRLDYDGEPDEEDEIEIDFEAE